MKNSFSRTTYIVGDSSNLTRSTGTDTFSAASFAGKAPSGLPIGNTSDGFAGFACFALFSLAVSMVVGTYSFSGGTYGATGATAGAFVKVPSSLILEII